MSSILLTKSASRERLKVRMSLLATAKLNRAEPQAWLTDVLERMVTGRTKATELARLLPWSWQADCPCLKAVTVRRGPR
jgi:IS66 C-terminal element